MTDGHRSGPPVLAAAPAQRDDTGSRHTCRRIRMAEIEIHHAHTGHETDPLATRVGIAVGLIGVALAVVTIVSHREHTAAVIHRTEANDQWSYYQAKKVREHTSEVGAELATALGAEGPKVEAAVRKLQASSAKYRADAEAIKTTAEAKDHETQHAELRALRFDLGEGFLELGLVLTSLYFLGRQRIFPLGGGTSALLGLALSLSALLI
jgi:hypothetical protein